MSTLDFNNLTSTILLEPNSTLGFSDLFLTEISSPLAVDPNTYPYPASRFLWAWPAVVTEDGATVCLFFHASASHVQQGDCPLPPPEILT